MKIIQKIYKGVGLVSEWTGKIGRWLVVIIIAIVCYDVFMRFALNSPTTWVWSLSYMLLACFSALGLGYTYYHKGNVRVDVIYTKLSPKTKLLIDVFFTVVLFFPLMFMITRVFIGNTFLAYSLSEFEQRQIWYPLTWPFKSVVAVGFVLLCLQGIATFLKDVTALAKGGKEPW